MNKLETSVQTYMAEQSQGDKGLRDQDQGKSLSSGEQQKEAGDPFLGAGQESAPAPSEAAGPSLSEIADPSSAKVAEPYNP